MKRRDVAGWPVTSLAVMQQFGRDRVESGHRADIADIIDWSKMTQLRLRHRAHHSLAADWRKKARPFER
jgi:hypothetical protein